VSDSFIKILQAAEFGFEVLQATRKYQKTLILEGFEGVERRVMLDRRTNELARIRMLKRKRLIEVNRIGNRLIYSLTSHGKARLSLLELKYAPKRADSKITFVLFDIPESLRTVRKRLSRFLKNAGFSHAQKSVWMTEKDSSALLKNWLEKNKLSEWVMVLLAEKL